MFRSDAHAHEPDEKSSQQPSDNSDTDFDSPKQYTETQRGQTLADHNDNETESEQQPPPDNANIDSNGSNMHHMSVRTPQW